jgi:5-methyltetrahydrofolate--homocysteine methyltransferase
MKADLLKTLQDHVLLSDGAMGTELQRTGLKPGNVSEIWNVEQSGKIQALHRAYLDAGAQLLTTNSFRGNHFALSHFGLGSRVDELNRSAARLAREVAGEATWVMGSIGPLGGSPEPLGGATPRAAFEAFCKQARALLAGGADAVLIETMSTLEEVRLAIQAAREAGAPVIASTMSFSKTRDGYRTMLGVSPEQAAKAMEETGADIVGCNCGTELEMEDHEMIVRSMRTFTLKPIIVRPNAGRPEIQGTKMVYRRAAEAMADKVPDLVRAGANIVGGCCGTGPEHIRLFANRLKQIQIPKPKSQSPTEI